MQKINGAFDSQRLALNLGVYSFWVCSGLPTMWPYSGNRKLRCSAWAVGFGMQSLVVGDFGSRPSHLVDGSSRALVSRSQGAGFCLEVQEQG